MGYTIKIGEACWESPKEYDWDYAEEGVYLRLDAKSEKHDNAPSFGEPTDFSNERWPSYTSWYEFLKDANIVNFFYDKNERTIGGHPGGFMLTERHRAMVEGASVYLKTLYPKAFEYAENGGKWPDNKDEIIDGYGCCSRIIWLKYWVNWALDNCDHPVVANS